MTERDAVTIGHASAADAAEILRLQRLTYVSEAEIYGDHDIEPLTQTLDDLRETFASHTVLKAVFEAADGTRLIGSVRAAAHGGTCHIGRLMVHPDHQNRGLGTALMAAIEAEFPDVRRCELFTGHLSLKNLHLYTRLGYREFARRPVSARLTLVFMEKTRGSRNQVPSRSTG